MAFLDLTRENDIHVRARTGWTFARSDDGSALVARGAGGITVPLGEWIDGCEGANALFTEGAPLAAVRDEVLQAVDPEVAARYLLWLQGLSDWGFVEFPLVDPDGERAVAHPQRLREAPSLAPEPPAQDRELSRFALLRREGGTWILESPLVGTRLAFADAGALDAPVVRRALAAAGFLEDAEDGGPERREALRMWEFHDLLFHYHHRVGWHRDPFGGLFPFIGEIEAPPAVRPPWPGERIPLARAEGDGGESFASVLERRRSERAYDEDHPITLAQLGALLDRVARIRRRQTVEVVNAFGRTGSIEITNRPYPTGGASYELEIYPVVDRCDGLDSGLYHYDPDAHELVRVTGRTGEVEQMLAEANVATVGLAKPQILFAIAARFGRVMWKYRAIAYGVILRNSGSLYQTLYLAATEQGLSPCGIGSGNSGLFARATGLDPVIEGSVGEFILGGRPAPT